MATRITIQDLFEKKLYDTKQVLVLKDLPESHFSQDGIENYIEVVTGKCLVFYCNTSSIGQANSMVAVLGEDIEDIKQIRQKPFVGKQVHFERLSAVGGLVVFDVGSVSQDTVELYFDNPKRSGGKEDTVRKVEVHRIEQRILAMVTINDEEAIRSILSRPDHKIGAQKLVIEPYFPAFHDHLIQCIQQSKWKTEAVKGQTDNTKLSATHPAPLQNKTKEVFETSVGDNSETTEEIKLNSATFVRSRIKHFEKPLTEQKQHTLSDLCEGHKPFKSIPRINKAVSNLRIFEDGKEECIVETADESSTIYKTYDGHVTKTSDLYNKATDNRPAVYNSDYKRAAFGKDKKTGKTRSNKARLTVEESVDKEKTFVEDLKALSRTKIVLLKIGGFQRKCRENQLDVDIIIQEAQTTVTLRTNIEKDLTNAKLIMHEILHLTKQKAVTISPKERANFLARSSIQQFLRNKAKAKKIGTVFEMNMNCNELVCYAFSDENLDKGISLVDEVFTKETIELRDGQKQLLDSQEWTDFQTKTSTDLIVIYDTSDSIIIEAVCTLKWDVLKDTRRVVTEFLKAYTPKEKADIEVHGGQAEYFQKYRAKDLEDRLRHMQVKLYIKKTKQDRPIRLLVTVEGNTRCFDEVKAEITSIWHEQIDFKKIASEESDVWLIMRSLDGDVGREFFRHFQHDNKCIIQVVRDGEIKPPPIRISLRDTQTRDVMNYKADTRPTGHRKLDVYQRIATRPLIPKRSDSEDTDDELQRFKQSTGNVRTDNDYIEDNVELFEETEPIWNSPEKRMDNYLRFQSGVREDEAIAFALKASQQDQLQPVESIRDYGLYQEELMTFTPAQPSVQFTPFPSSNHSVYEGEEKNNSIMIGNVRMMLVQGQITNQKADALVNIVDPSGEFPGQSIVSKAFLRTAGPQLAQLYNQKLSGVNVMMIQPLAEPYMYLTITDSTSRLQCKDVVHAKLMKNKLQVLPAVMREIYQACSDKGYTSIAMPPLGVGRLYQYPAKQVASHMLSETFSFFQQGIHVLNQIQEIKIVVYNKDNDTYDAFDNAFDEYKSCHTWANRRTLPSRGIQAPVPQKSISQPNMNIMPVHRPLSSKVQPALKHMKQPVRRQAPGYTNQTAVLPSLRQHRVDISKESYEEDGRNQEVHVRNSVDVIQRLKKQRLQEQQHVRRGRVQQSQDHPYRERRPRSEERQQGHGRSYGKQNTADERRRHANTPDTFGGYREDRRGRSKSRERPPLGQGLRRKELDNVTEENKYKKKAVRKSRFSENPASSKLAVTVIAGNKEECERARTVLSKKIKEEFLHQIDLKKIAHISTEAKQKIVKVIERHKVKSIKSNGRYQIRGYKDNVRKANEEILQVLLEDKPADRHTERKRRKSKLTRASVEFSRFMALEDVEVPKYWNFKPGELLKNIFIDLKQLLTKTKFEKVTLGANDHAYTTIIRLINETFNADSDKVGQGKDASGIPSYRQLYVHKVCRIENPELYGEYASKRSELFRRLLKKESGYFSKLAKVKCGDKQPTTSSLERDKELGTDVYTEVNECYFFHGTKSENIDKICSDGLESRLCSPDAMFGQGIYGAESVVKADQYTDSKDSRSDGRKKMFLMRMLLGDIFVCRDTNPHKYKLAPCTSCYKDNCVNSSHHYHFDSVVGGMNKLFREFVVYESKQCYPEYLITYERRK